MKYNKLGSGGLKCLVVSSFMLLNVPGVMAQGQQVKGIIKDAKGEPVIGASVVVKGQKQGVVTDIDGNFTLKADPNSTLVVSYIGYQRQEVPVAGKTSLSVIMQDNTTQLNDLVVVGYGTQKKVSLTSAISMVDSKVFQDRPVASAATALQGTIPGLTVSRTSTRPGNEGLAFKIRGDISVNGNSSPLIIIDGITSSMDEFSSMDPSNIESVSVLKDASAAIYGARSASGVVLVTTKKGKGKAKITYNGSVTASIQGIQPPITNAQQWMTMFKQAQINDAAAAGQKDINWWIFQDYGGEETVNKIINGEVFSQQQGSQLVRYDPVNLQNVMYGSATNTNHSVSVSGSTDRISYFASLGYYYGQSQLKIARDGEKRYTGRVNTSYKINDFLKTSFDISYERRKVTTPSQGVGTGWNDMYLFPIKNEAGQWYDTFGKRNPVAYIEDGGQTNKLMETMRANAGLDIDLNKFVKGLTFKLQGSYKKYEISNTEQKLPVALYDWAGLQTANQNLGGKPVYASLSESIQRYDNQNYGAFVNYDRSFKDVHNVSVMLGMTAEQEKSKTISASRDGGELYPGSGLTDLNAYIGSDGYVHNGGGQTEWGLVSYLGRAHYDYAGKYLIEVLGRRDGSSKLVSNQRWKNFYSVSAGWRISEERFMKGLTFLSNLKLRYNYGKTGSVEGIGNYESYMTLSTGSALFGTEGGFTTYPSIWINGMVSTTRTWETIKSHDIGLDFGFFHDKLTGSFDWYHKVNDGMFINVAYPAMLGTAAPKSNGGKFTTKGWEFEINWNDAIGEVRYNVGFNLSDTRSKINYIASVARSYAGNNATLQGYPLNALFVYQTNGIFQTQAEVDAYYKQYYYEADGKTVKKGNMIPAPTGEGGDLANRLRPGAFRYVDVDGDGVITDKDIVYKGDKAPHFQFGLKLGLNWKAIDFSAFFQGVGKQNVMRGGYLAAPFMTNYTQQNYHFIGKTWSEDNPNAEYGILSRSQNFNKWNYMNTDVLLQDSRYVRLKSLIVGYTLPGNWTKRAGIDKVRLYFSGEDLFELTSIKDGYDPEYGENSNGTYPFARMLTFGIDVTF